MRIVQHLNIYGIGADDVIDHTREQVLIVDFNFQYLLSPRKSSSHTIFSTVMAPGNNTLKYCNCCKQFITKGAELVHRRAMFSHPYASARPQSSTAILNLNSVFKSAELSSTTHSTDSTATDSQMVSDVDGPT